MRIAIVGPGLIGRSIALAAQRSNPALHITEIDKGQLLEPARGADLIVLATPVDAILDILHTNADLLRDTVCIDTGSTKRAIVHAAQDAGLKTFVGSHPMAGAATSGASAARADLFDSRDWFIVPHDADASAVTRARSFIESLGARTVMMSDDGAEHDRVMAAVSHLPQVVAAALMMVVAGAARDHLHWAGAGLRDTTRLAQSSGDVWQSILDTNADELRPLLHAVAQQLNEVAERLGDGVSVRDFLAGANRARALL